MTKIQVLTGIPASGKSTWAKQEVLEGNGSVVRVNKDEIRSMVWGDKFSKEREKITENIRDNIILQAIESKNIDRILVDDTNLNPKHYNRICEFLTNKGDIIERVWFPDSLNVDLCHKRNIDRSRSVPHHVIEKMYRDYMKLTLEHQGDPYPMVNTNGDDTYIFDIDGTLSERGNRSPYDWKNVGNDTVKENVLSFLEEISEFNTVIIFSGRDGVCRKETEDWLAKNLIPYDYLYMRAEDDKRKDYVVKQELYETYIYPYYHVKLVVDDRDQVVRMWRALGLECWQVQNGSF